MVVMTRSRHSPLMMGCIQSRSCVCRLPQGLAGADRQTGGVLQPCRRTCVSSDRHNGSFFFLALLVRTEFCDGLQLAAPWSIEAFSFVDFPLLHLHLLYSVSLLFCKCVFYSVPPFFPPLPDPTSLFLVWFGLSLICFVCMCAYFFVFFFFFLSLKIMSWVSPQSTFESLCLSSCPQFVICRCLCSYSSSYYSYYYSYYY